MENAIDEVADYITKRISKVNCKTIICLKTVPEIDLRDYIHRIHIYGLHKDDINHLYYALVLMDRLPIKFTLYNVHILYYLSYYYSSIYMSDYLMNIKQVCHIGGVHHDQMVMLSMTYLKIIDYNISISEKDFSDLRYNMNKSTKKRCI
jgi:hypothetical protein